MAYRTKTYTLREETAEGGARYFISFKDGQGKYHELEVFYAFYLEFRRLELDNRKIQNWDWRHREFNEVWEETLQRRALRLPKSLDELLLDAERDELLYQTIDALPETQRRRFLLHYDCGYTYPMIGALEGCSEGAARQSAILAREKVRAAMQKLQTVDADALLYEPLEKPSFVVDGLIPTGLILFCGAQKIGKSWLMLKLCLCVSQGLPLWKMPTAQGDVLYLCLEDTFSRIQDRLFQVTDEANGRLHFAVASGKLTDGLIVQLEDYLKDYPASKMLSLIPCRKYAQRQRTMPIPMPVITGIYLC